MLEYLRRQPSVSFTWGNHDVAWIGAGLGQDALIAHVLRISIRYRRLSQLEEGYGITLQPLEHLVRTVYKDDPAQVFTPKGSGLRETDTMARMQKAAAVMQWKLEGQTIARHPEWQMDHRRLLRRGGRRLLPRRTNPRSGETHVELECAGRVRLGLHHRPTLRCAMGEAPPHRTHLSLGVAV